MVVHTQVTETDLNAFLSRYSLGQLQRYWPASEGIENTNYFLRLASGQQSHEFVLTLLEQPTHAGQLLVPLLDSCHAAGLPVPWVIRDSQGQAWGKLLGKPAILCPRLPGRHLLNPALRHCAAVGRFLARLHLKARPLRMQAPLHPRNQDWLLAQARQAQGLGYGDRSLLLLAVKATRSLLNRADVSRLPQGIIHGDLFRDNVLFSAQSLTGVLDFHHAARGFWLFDLTVAINDWCTDNSGQLDPERTYALLTAYHGVRPLTQLELWFFPSFCLYAALCFWLSRLNVPAGGRRKNPAVFRDILAQHLAHPYYPDGRMLRASLRTDAPGSGKQL